MSAISIQQQVSLQTYNTLAVPAFARWFITVDNEDELHQALAFYRQQCQRQACDLLLLGGGSNIVLSGDFSGVVIHVNIRGRVIEQETEDRILLSVAAGEQWHNTVMYCVDNGWYGVENLALIPGRVGAAPIQNIGAYGVELMDCFHYLEAIDIATGERLRLDRQACEFAYRDSVFKRRLKDKVVITRVVLSLSKHPCWVLDYPALKDYLGDVDKASLTALTVANAVIQIRQSKLPDPLDIPNAGSFFKNPIVDQQTYHRLKQQYPEIIAFPQADQRYKLAAAWLLDNAGWRGRCIDGVSMHQKQALVLTNVNRMRGSHLLDFVKRITKDIFQRYHIALEIEPRVW